MEIASDEKPAFPRLKPKDEMERVRETGQTPRGTRDGDIVFKAGDENIDFHVIESGKLRNHQSDRRRCGSHRARARRVRRPISTCSPRRPGDRDGGSPRGRDRAPVGGGTATFARCWRPFPSSVRRCWWAFTARRELLSRAGASSG